MFYKKTSTNYRKWDMYESNSEDSEEKEPIVPKDDPQFKAMEADFEKRAKDRRESKAKAEISKALGNDCMKKGLYRTAHKHYSEALEVKKDFLVGYSNRALARLRLELWVEAIDDCTRILEYTEVFNGCVENDPDICYKAYIRRA
jgi:tetratricopeptide (TPR) repeat protein